MKTVSLYQIVSFKEGTWEKNKEKHLGSESSDQQWNIFSHSSLKWSFSSCGLTSEEEWHQIKATESLFYEGTAHGVWTFLLDQWFTHLPITDKWTVYQPDSLPESTQLATAACLWKYDSFLAFWLFYWIIPKPT